jgi:hypothetical protein
MDAQQAGTAAETHLNDLQADIEACSRLIDQTHHGVARIRDALSTRGEQAAEIALTMKQLTELKACALQQRKTIRELRHDLRVMRSLLNEQI